MFQFRISVGRSKEMGEAVNKVIDCSGNSGIVLENKALSRLPESIPMYRKSYTFSEIILLSFVEFFFKVRHKSPALARQDL
jgi:hypothetical protein